MGIYDIFRMAAEGVERVPWRFKLLAGAGGGAIAGALLDRSDVSFGEKIARGALVGGTLGFGAGMVLRGAGDVAAGAGRLTKAGLVSKYSELRGTGFKALMRPGTLALAGAAAGAAIAPSGSRTQGAMIGAAAGLAIGPVKNIYKGYTALGKVPGLQTAALVGLSAATITAAGMFTRPVPQASAAAMRGEGEVIDYTPMSGNMQDRMAAINATGDIVLGLNGRKHG